MGMPPVPPAIARSVESHNSVQPDGFQDRLNRIRISAANREQPVERGGIEALPKIDPATLSVGDRKLMSAAIHAVMSENDPQALQRIDLGGSKSYLADRVRLAQDVAQYQEFVKTGGRDLTAEADLRKRIGRVEFGRAEPQRVVPEGQQSTVRARVSIAPGGQASATRNQRIAIEGLGARSTKSARKMEASLAFGQKGAQTDGVSGSPQGKSVHLDPKSFVKAPGQVDPVAYQGKKVHLEL